LEAHLPIHLHITSSFSFSQLLRSFYFFITYFYLFFLPGLVNVAEKLAFLREGIEISTLHSDVTRRASWPTPAIFGPCDRATAWKHGSQAVQISWHVLSGDHLILTQGGLTNEVIMSMQSCSNPILWFLLLFQILEDQLLLIEFQQWTEEWTPHELDPPPEEARMPAGFESAPFAGVGRETPHFQLPKPAQVVTTEDPGKPWRHRNYILHRRGQPSKRPFFTTTAR
jgi:hypothetical protein